MTVSRDFNSLLNQYLPYKMLSEEVIKRDYFLKTVTKDNNWKGADLKVPFMAGQASSYKFGGIVPAAQISQMKPVVGTVSGYKECWAALKFQSADLIEHDGKINEQTFLGNILDTIPGFVQGFKEVISTGLLGSKFFASLTATSSANDGVITVDRPERFTYMQKVIVTEKTGTTHSVTGFVSAINMNTNEVILVTALNGSTPVDFSSGSNTQTITNTPQCFWEGASSAGLTSLRSVLLSYVNGGDANIYGISKVLYPYTQAINIDGSGFTKVNILEGIFDAFNDTRKKGKGHPYTVIVSYKHLGNCMKNIELSKGAFKMVNGVKASLFGWTEIEITGVKGTITLVGVQEMDDDVIYLLDFDSMKLHSNGFIRRHTDLNGNQWYTTRDDTNGYNFITDHLFFGDLVVSAPCKNGIIYGISYT